MSHIPPPPGVTLLSARSDTPRRITTLSRRRCYWAPPQGFSHKKNASFVQFHAESPTTPAVLSECCSCIADGNQRLRGTRGLPECIADENTPGLLPYVSGSLGVWCAPPQNLSSPAHPPFALAARNACCVHANGRTLMDYFGEPRGTGTSSWPYVSSDFGQFDIAGFPKPHAYWYAANWLQVLLPPPLTRSLFGRVCPSL